MGVAPKTFHRRCTVRRHATTTPERMPARGLARRDWREFNERKDWSGWPSGRGWPGIPRDRGARGGRVCTAKGAAGGLDDVASIRAAEGRPERLATAPRNKPARADGAAGRERGLHPRTPFADSKRSTPRPRNPPPAPAVPLAEIRPTKGLSLCDIGGFQAVADEVELIGAV